jgi:ectoine hydroxylase-related dioxygenase (phytanoyl-CoA dioxygenase family)
VQNSDFSQAQNALKTQGFIIIENVFDSAFIEKSKNSMYMVQKRIVEEVGQSRLERAGEVGVLRLMMKYHAHFFEYLESPTMLGLIDSLLSPTAILHLQNGFILPSEDLRPAQIFQNSFHMDFPRVLNGYLASINIMVCIDDFSVENGATMVVPGSHQKMVAPEKIAMQTEAVPVICPAGSVFVFDSTLWHAAGTNRSGSDRLAINHQFTRSFFKPQIDYIRALGEETILALPPRSQQLLGYYSRVPANLDQFYQPEETRYYRRHQG